MRTDRDYSDHPENEFMECGVCDEKTGSPILCPVCLHNRRLIGKQKGALATLREKINLATRMLNL